jgi:hypothetical protein
VAYLKKLHWHLPERAEKLRNLIKVTHLLVHCTFSPRGFKPSTNISVNMFLEREILVITNEALETRNVKVCVQVINICTIFA